MVITAFLWSIAGLFIKFITWNPFNIAFMRSLIAVFFIFIAIRKINFKFSFPMVAAGVANSLTMILFVTANKTTSAANAILLQYMAPVITVFLGFFILKEKIYFYNIISVILIIAGIIIMFFDKLSYGNVTGNILAVISAFTFSLYFIFLRMQKDGSTIESVLLSHVLTVLVCFLISLFFPFPELSIVSITSVLVLGIFQIGLSSILLSIAIKKISAVTANLIAVIEPVFNPIWVFVVIKEKPGINTILGGLLIIISVMLSTLITSKRNSI